MWWLLVWCDHPSRLPALYWCLWIQSHPLLIFVIPPQSLLNLLLLVPVGGVQEFLHLFGVHTVEQRMSRYLLLFLLCSLYTRWWFWLLGYHQIVRETMTLFLVSYLYLSLSLLTSSYLWPSLWCLLGGKEICLSLFCCILLSLLDAWIISLVFCGICPRYLFLFNLIFFLESNYTGL